MKKKLTINQINGMMWLLIIVSMIVAFFFCMQKQGFHYDEYYSYYSTNISEGMWLPDGDWRTGSSIAGEYMANEGEPLGLDVVRISQSYDVHPPMYYFVLRIVSFMSKGIFSKWQGLAINMFFYLLSLIIIWNMTSILSDNDPVIQAFTVLISGLSPAVISTVMMVRMYSMLTCECLLVTYICVRAINKKQYDWGHLIIPVSLLSFFGFMTHYYFVIYLFFVAAFICIYMVIKKETRVKAFILGAGICLGMGIGVLYYPYCYSHIFKGYRGNDATGAFFDLNNTIDRMRFYTGILNDYTFSGAFYVAILMVILLYVLCRFRKKVNAGSIRPELYLVIIVCTGYFVIVSKTATALSNPVEAMRYHSPIYMPVIMLVVMAVCRLLQHSGMRKATLGILAILTALQIYGLVNEKVFFLYKEDVDDYAFSMEHSSDCVAYIYNPVNKWMVWDDSKELMNYDRIYFISIDNADEITDELINTCDRMIVYTCRSDQSQEIIQRMLDSNSSLSESNMCAQRLYVDVYELK